MNKTKYPIASKQASLFEEGKRTRNVEGFVKTNSKDGTLSVTIDPDLAGRIRKYCWTRNRNCKKLVNQIVREKMEELESSRFDDMSREDLMSLIVRMEAERGLS